MAKINLLPWREALREQRKKEFISICVAVFLLALVLAALIWAFFNQRMSDQQQANQLIQQANSQLDVQLKSLDGLKARREEIIQRMKLIQDLQGKRPVVVRLFDTLVRVMPPNMYLTKFSRMGDKFTIEGRAESPNAVSELLRNLEASRWYRNAFMNSYQGAEQIQKPSGSVAPRPEDSYGAFVVTVDLGGDALNPVTGAPIAPVVPGQAPAVTPGAVPAAPALTPPVAQANQAAAPAVNANQPVQVTLPTSGVNAAPTAATPAATNLPPANATPANKGVKP